MTYDTPGYALRTGWDDVVRVWPFLRVFHTDDYDELVLLLTQMVEKLRVMGMGRKRKDDVSVFLLPGKLTFVCPIL